MTTFLLNHYTLVINYSWPDYFTIEKCNAKENNLFFGVFFSYIKAIRANIGSWLNSAPQIAWTWILVVA